MCFNNKKKLELKVIVSIFSTRNLLKAGKESTADFSLLHPVVVLARQNIIWTRLCIECRVMKQIFSSNLSKKSTSFQEDVVEYLFKRENWWFSKCCVYRKSYTATFWRLKILFNINLFFNQSKQHLLSLPEQIILVHQYYVNNLYPKDNFFQIW